MERSFCTFVGEVEFTNGNDLSGSALGLLPSAQKVHLAASNSHRDQLPYFMSIFLLVKPIAVYMISNEREGDLYGNFWRIASFLEPSLQVPMLGKLFEILKCNLTDQLSTICKTNLTYPHTHYFTKVNPDSAGFEMQLEKYFSTNCIFKSANVVSMFPIGLTPVTSNHLSFKLFPLVLTNVNKLHSKLAEIVDIQWGNSYLYYQSGGSHPQEIFINEHLLRPGGAAFLSFEDTVFFYFHSCCYKLPSPNRISNVKGICQKYRKVVVNKNSNQINSDKFKELCGLCLAATKTATYVSIKSVKNNAKCFKIQYFSRGKNDIFLGRKQLPIELVIPIANIGREVDVSQNAYLPGSIDISHNYIKFTFDISLLDLVKSQGKLQYQTKVMSAF
ncbi:hypothetical protein EGR_00619 [Echinococcus granulosus]|uniref:Uncharacterized protein n=1 Tax=Echinococcus granulosus TaxID=6210 RepID=W6VCP4_ECHGR|nr:hypothetical protein EGR_00619 [Echinococcus granulosus]EUB64669.1 hypothetical protein EGR_00619 [Echinococcus granulosus]